MLPITGAFLILTLAVQAANPTAISLTLPQSPGGITQNGKATLVSFTAMGKYRVNGTFSDQNMLELVQTWVANPVYGDMLYELRYTNYKDFGGVKWFSCQERSGSALGRRHRDANC